MSPRGALQRRLGSPAPPVEGVVVVVVGVHVDPDLRDGPERTHLQAETDGGGDERGTLARRPGDVANVKLKDQPRVRAPSG